MRSMTPVRKSPAERFICSIPASRPEVHTLVAIKADSRASSSATKSPTTPSARPYMGELSMILAPPAKNNRSTSASVRRVAAPPPTSKACQVPSPMTGRASPVLGIGLVIIVAFDGSILFVLRSFRHNLAISSGSHAADNQAPGQQPDNRPLDCPCARHARAANLHVGRRTTCYGADGRRQNHGFKQNRALRRYIAMKVLVDHKLCEGNGRCIEVASEVFELRDDDRSYVRVERPAANLSSNV